LRFHQQPQLRRPPGTRRPDAPSEPNDRRCRSHHGTLHRYPQLAVSLTLAGDELLAKSLGGLLKPFRIHTGLVAPLYRANIDTDQIIPKQFLKRIERTGFGEFLFYDWRHNQPEPFVLDVPSYSGASILVTGKNFGCGSSREHAVWALADFGFRVMIAPSFADIFANNCLKNGVLTVVLKEQEAEEIARRATEIPDYQLIVDLEGCTVRDDQGFATSFPIDEFTRHCLLDGLDDIGLTLQHQAEISAYESRHPVPAAWKS
jgi:3-isopropylmalate/(R)-2-methylmalate dehydratase small subunit